MPVFAEPFQVERRHPAETGCRQCLVVSERECDYSAGRHAAEGRIPRLRCAHEYRQQTLVSTGGKTASPPLRERDRAVRPRRPLCRCELVVWDCGREDGGALDWSSVTCLDH